MRKLIVGVIGVIGTLGVMSATAGSPRPASLSHPASMSATTSIDDGALEVWLEPHGGRTTFSQGEPIALDLVLKARDGGAAGPWIYEINERTAGVSRQIDVSPTAGWFRGHGVDHFDVVTLIAVGVKPLRLPVMVNRAITFQQPGRFELSVTTEIQRSATSKSPAPSMSSSTRMRITTPPLAIEVTASDETAEAARVAALVATIEKGGACRGVDTAARQLAFLGGEAATREKVRLFTAQACHCQGADQALREGLASSRHLPLQLALLHLAWTDTSHAPDDSLHQAMINTQAWLRGETVPGWQGIVDPKDPQGLRMARDSAVAVDELVDSLPRREGVNQAETAYLLMALLPLDEDQRVRVRPFALRHFVEMSTLQRGMLMSERNKPALCGALDGAPDEQLSPASRAALAASCAAS